MRIYHWIDSCFNCYYKLKRNYTKATSCNIVYSDYTLKGTIKSSFINNKRIVYPEPISYSELKQKLINKEL